MCGGIAERIAPADLGALQFAGRDYYDVACNWKVYVDSFLEGYHLPHVHPGLSRVLDYRAYTTELRVVLAAARRRCAAEEGQRIYGDGELVLLR